MIPRKHQRFFRGRKIQREANKNRYYAFDIECAGLNPTKPLLICVVPFEQYTKRMPTEWVFKGRECKRDFIEWLESLPSTFNHIILGHNGSRFDVYSVFDKWGILSATKFERNGTIFWIQYKKNIEFRDSKHILQAPLKAFGAKGITPMKFINPKHPDFGSYEAIDDEDIEYCIQDCIVLKNALVEMKNMLSEWIDVENVKLPLTAASMAHRVWTMKFFPDEWKWIRQKGKNAGQLMYQTYIDERSEEVARKAYYGGRVQVIGEAGMQYPNVMSLDRNSMYPAVMVKEYPNPTKSQPVSDIAIVRRVGVPYWGRFTLRATKGAVKFLPALNDDDRRDYTQETFDGFLCSPEVEYALENGWVIESYSNVWCSTETITPFKKYVEFFYSLRKEMKENDDERQSLIKLLLNALYGVFGTKGQFDRIENEEEIIEALEENPDGYETHFWNAESDTFYLVSKEYKEPPQHTCFIWAAFVTSYARVSLDKAIQQVNEWGHEVVYVDTDSVHYTGFDGDLTNCPLDIGKSLGEWDIESVEHEGETHDIAQYAQYFEPKVYTWFVEKEPIKIKHKGCSDSGGDPTKPQVNRSVILYRMALRRQLEAGVEIETVKKSKRWCK